MTVSVLIISHFKIGDALLSATKKMVEYIPLRMDQLEIAFDMPLDEAHLLVEAKIQHLDLGDGVLILTDLFGATPCNVANQFQTDQIRVVAGVNLPMLLKLVTNPRVSLDEMVEKAVDGGQNGILRCQDYQYA
ncbi:MAG: hypothetical protein HOM11_01000 [Methylococcales bacterium]|jgi:mannose PTS system EIIA component|nr:hypothetical protein [Methylococcales bacterium]MBT7445133.1 hypothetical protein [Methylococcales bacterium]